LLIAEQSGKHKVTRRRNDLGIDQHCAEVNARMNDGSCPMIRTAHYYYSAGGTNPSTTTMLPGTDSSRSGNTSW
jgi:hypothetical protein